jgi:hypothetical protein
MFIGERGGNNELYMLDVLKPDRGQNRGCGWRCSHYSVLKIFGASK